MPSLFPLFTAAEQQHGSVLRTVSAATLSVTTLVDGDILRVVIVVAGAAGNQAFGVAATCIYDEVPS